MTINMFIIIIPCLPATVLRKKEAKAWKCLERKKVYEARDDKTVYMELFLDKVLTPKGNTFSYTHYRSSDVVVVVPFIDDKTLVMIRQYRYPLNKLLLEFPAGHVEKGESPLTTAKRELREETGYNAKELAYVYAYHPSVSKSKQLVHVFIANSLARGKTDHDSTEDIDVEIVKISRLRKMIIKRKVENAGTLVAYLLCCSGIINVGNKKDKSRKPYAYTSIGQKRNQKR
jgi:ADP-ribose pyrophosphatase